MNPEIPPPAPQRRRSLPGVFAVAALLLAVAAAAVGFTLARNHNAAAATPSTLTAATTTSSPATAGSSPTTTSGATSEDVTTTAAGGTDPEPAVTITKVTSGSGEDTITYFVADIVLASGATLQSAIAGGDLEGRTAETSELAAAAGALLAVNGDNAVDRSDGIIIRNGVLYRDRPARLGLAIYQDGTAQVYDETQTSGEELLAAGVWNTFSFGPPLLVDGVAADDLDTVEVEVNPQHGIQGSQPRTGFGYLATGHYVFVVVDGRSAGYSRGVTLAEFAAIFQDLGCSLAYNLDGGGSSTLYYQGEVVNNPLGRGQERAVGDILYVS